MTDVPLSIELSGACNVRDLGGGLTDGGRRVRRGLLIRGDSPHNVTRDDLTVLAGLRLRTVIDLRSAAEIEVLGEEPLGALGVTTVHVPLRHAPDAEQVLKVMQDPDAPRLTLAQLYRGFLRNSGPEFVQITELAADADRRPIFFHCLAGKDRTGVVAALLLSVLGVGDDVIASDYEATAAAMPRLRELSAPDRERLGLVDFQKINPALMGADAATMITFLGAVREEYGGVEQYLTGQGASAQSIGALRDALLTG